MRNLYTPNSETTDVFIQNPPLQPKKSVVEAVAALGICGTPMIFDDLAASIEYVDANDKSDVLVRSEDPKEYKGASGIFRSVLLRTRLENSRDDTFHWPSLEEYLAVDTDIAAVSSESEIDDSLEGYYLPIDLGKASLSYWEHIPGRKIVAVRDIAQKDTVHLIDEWSWHTRNTITGETHFLQAGTDLNNDEYDRVAETFMAIEESGLFDPKAAYMGEFVMRNSGEVALVQMHHTGNHRNYDHELIPSREFTHEWEKASLVVGSTNGVEERVIRRVLYGQDKEVLDANTGIVDLSVHPALGSRARNIYGLRARTQFHHLHASTIAPEISGGHSGRSLVFKPRLSVAPSFHDSKNFDDASPINHAEFRLEVASDGHDAYYRIREA